MKKPCVIAVGMQKGGVGKTTFAVNIAGFLANAGHKTLLVDMDAQASATSFFTSEILSPEQTLAALFCENSKYEIVRENKEIIMKSSTEKLDVAPAHIQMSVAEAGFFELEPTRRLSYWIEDSCQDYDYIVIDSPPSLGRLTMNVLMAADHVILPCLPEPQSVNAVPIFLKIVEHVKSAKRDLSLLGVVINGLVAKQKAHSHYEDVLQSTGKVIGTIHRATLLIELSHSKELLSNISNKNDVKSKRVFLEFSEIAKKIIEKTIGD